MDYFILMCVVALCGITSFQLGRKNGSQVTLAYLEREGYITYEEDSDSSDADSSN